jgi:hypothetical protein
MSKRPQPMLVLLAPLLGITIFCAAQTGLQTVRPDGLDIWIVPRTTADYRPWPRDQFQPVDPALGTLAAQDGNPTRVIVNTPDPNVTPASWVFPTSNQTSQPGLIATSTPTDVPEPTNTLMPSGTPTLTNPQTPTGTLTNTPQPNSTRKPKPTKKPPGPKKTPPGKGKGKD